MARRTLPSSLNQVDPPTAETEKSISMMGSGDDSVLAAPGIPEVFLAGDTAAGLEQIRTRLLDLTKRNRLLNFRPSKSSSAQIPGGRRRPTAPQATRSPTCASCNVPGRCNRIHVKWSLG